MRGSGGISLALLLLVAALTPLRVQAQADGPEDPDEIPSFGWPKELPFSGASGSFAIETEADSDSVQVEDPLTLLVRITANGPVRKPPLRLSLGDLPAFREAFHLEELANPTTDISHLIKQVGLSNPWAFPGGLAPQTAWEFHYRLRPKNLDVKAVPAVPFVFYDRRILNPEKRFMTRYSEAIPIQVKPREAVQTSVQGPEEAFQFAGGRGLLLRNRPWSPPGMGLLAVLLLVPPLVCLGWYLVWRRLNPNKVRQVRQRRSRAASVALGLLRRLPAAPEQRAFMAGTAVTRYLRLRLDLPFEEPTPRETADYLARHGCSLEVASAVMQFYQACAAVRFQPAPPDEVDLPQRAAQLILAVEGET